MSERNKPHNGRDTSGQHKVRREDVEDKLADPNGEDYIRDEVRLGGAVEDTGPTAGQEGERIGRLVEGNREEVERLAEATRDSLPDLRGQRGREGR